MFVDRDTPARRARHRVRCLWMGLRARYLQNIALPPINMALLTEGGCHGRIPAINIALLTEADAAGDPCYEHGPPDGGQNAAAAIPAINIALLTEAKR